MRTQDEWRTILERQLPPQTACIARNRAISACYARWYLQEPWLFKWAGMAAFASAQVGIALALVEMLDAPHDALRAEESFHRQEPSLLDLAVDLYGRGLNLALFIPIALHDAATRPLLLQDLELIQQANNAIFNDVGWAHLAYLQGGIAALEACLRAGEQAYLLEAFRMLDEGAHRLCNPADYADGCALIDRAAVAMLRHEQMTVLPVYLERLSDLGCRIASIGSWLDFEGAPGLVGQPSFSAYFGPLAVLMGTRSITRSADRWQWIEDDVLPKWARVCAAYGEDGVLHRRLQALADEQPTVLQQTAGLMHMGYSTLGLQLAPRSSSAAPAR